MAPRSTHSRDKEHQKNPEKKPRRPSIYKLNSQLPPQIAALSAMKHQTPNQGPNPAQASQQPAAQQQQPQTQAQESKPPVSQQPAQLQVQIPMADIPLSSAAYANTTGSGGGRATRGAGQGGGSGGGPTSSQYGGKHAHELFYILKDYMNKSDLTSYGQKPVPSPNLWTNLITNDRRTFSTIVTKVLADAKNMFKNEERMVSVASPLYVFGDIHGNFHDLRYYERELWPNGPGRAKVSYVFLGDFVDRGHHSLEVVLYLFCCKLMSKKNTFVLIRGNHELRAIQQAFTFHRECIEKLGSSLGAQIWASINKCFDNMPVAALIDQHIFCCHGGIPMSSQSIKDIYNVPCPLADPENQSPLAWELMWNDPLTNGVFGEMCELLKLQSGSRAFSALKGFLPNNKRGTAYYFSETAALKFMDNNNLSHVIRAHECLPTGYTLHSNQKLITVFSSSKYCGGNNDAACVFVEYDDVRVIRLDIGEHNAIPGPTREANQQ